MSSAPFDIGAMFGATDASTFLGYPAASPDAVDADVAIIGADTASPYPSVGAYCAGGAAAIRRAMASYAANAAHIDFDLGGPILSDGTRAVDCGDVEVGEDAAANRAAIRAAVDAILDRGAVPILLGGDDSTPVPLIEAVAARGPLAVLQIDAHIDWRDEVQGERLGLSSVMRRASELPNVTAQVQVGQRGIGSARLGDRDDALAAGVVLISARELHRDGVAAALEHVPAGADVLIALDVDAFDPSLVPGVIGPCPGGLTYWQVLDLIDGVAAKARIAAMNCVELVPARDVGGASALVAGRVVANVIGRVARQRGR